MIKGYSPIEMVASYEEKSMVFALFFFSGRKKKSIVMFY